LIVEIIHEGLLVFLENKGLTFMSILFFFYLLGLVLYTHLDFGEKGVIVSKLKLKVHNS
jgi:hypothetical protein